MVNTALMRCPNCGHDNPEGPHFCEECDWRTDQAVRMKLGINSVYMAYIALALGAVAAILSYTGYGIVGMILGAAGLFLGTYCLKALRLSGVKGGVKTTLLAMATAAMLLSVFGLMYGLTAL